ncbi:MAG: Gfo/Idh/MocA family oxidoreductase [Armatimonadetes bacterium]|nr:Gfo/Idh/MocA family oxidoreductase [Armatimonadota bacterium]
MPEPLGIAMLGTTHAHAAGKMDVLRAASSWRVIGACEPDVAALARQREHPSFRGVTWMTQEELLAHPDVQAVAVEGDVAENIALAQAAIAAGKPIHLDKPAGGDVAGAAELFAAAQRAGLIVQMGYMFRYNPAFRFIREALAQGWLGDLFFIRGRMSTNIPAERRPAMARFRGGMMFELGCHLLDQVVLLLGAPEQVQGFCRHDGPFEDDLADNTVAWFIYDRAVATLEVAAMETDPFPVRRFEVYGTEGSCVIEPLEPPALKVSFRTPPDGHPEGWHAIDLPEYHRYVDDLEELAACLREGRPLPYTPAHDLAVQAALVAAGGG